MKPSLSHHAAQDDVNIFELQNGLNIVFNEGEKILPIIFLKHSYDQFSSANLKLKFIDFVVLLRLRRKIYSRNSRMI